MEQGIHVHSVKQDFCLFLMSASHLRTTAKYVQSSEVDLESILVIHAGYYMVCTAHSGYSEKYCRHRESWNDVFFDSFSTRFGSQRNGLKDGKPGKCIANCGRICQPQGGFAEQSYCSSSFFVWSLVVKMEVARTAEFRIPSLRMIISSECGQEGDHLRLGRRVLRRNDGTG